MDLKNASIVITGAGSGIGAALALGLVEFAPRLTLVGRRQQPLDEVAVRVRQGGGQAHVVSVDLTEPGAPAAVVAAARAAYGGIDVLVNNAGNVRAGRLEDIEESEVLAQVALNLTAPILLTRAALPALRYSPQQHHRSNNQDLTRYRSALCQAAVRWRPVVIVSRLEE